MNSNALSGTIPDFSATFPYIQHLDLSNQKQPGFDGTIPRELFALAPLESLNLSGNSLTGAIPTVIGNLDVMRVVDLSMNNLTGPIPPLLGSYGQLEILDLSKNSLNGSIPSELGKLERKHHVSFTTLFLTFNPSRADTFSLVSTLNFQVHCKGLICLTTCCMGRSLWTSSSWRVLNYFWMGILPCKWNLRSHCSYH